MITVMTRGDDDSKIAIDARRGLRDIIDHHGARDEGSRAGSAAAIPFARPATQIDSAGPQAPHMLNARRSIPPGCSGGEAASPVDLVVMARGLRGDAFGAVPRPDGGVLLMAGGAYLLLQRTTSPPSAGRCSRGRWAAMEGPALVGPSCSPSRSRRLVVADDLRVGRHAVARARPAYRACAETNDPVSS